MVTSRTPSSSMTPIKNMYDSQTMSRRRVTLEGDGSTPPRMDGTKDDTAPAQHQTMPRSSQPTPATPIPIQSPPLSPTKHWEREYRILRQAYLKQEQRLKSLQEENVQLRTRMLALESTCSGRDNCHSTPPNHESNKTVYRSPGTRFVAELSEVMELDVGQHALLSSIIDRQADTKTKCAF